MASLRRGDNNNSMAKHFSIEHPEMDRTTDKLFTSSVVDRDEKNLNRYILEGLVIEDNILINNNTQLNQRGEWGRITTRRLTVADNGA